MAVDRYDFAIIGGGIGGAAFGKAMAERGASVLVLERTKTFADRIRGEWIAPWGVAELKELGLYDAVMERGAHTLPGFTTYSGRLGEKRDLVASARPGIPAVSFFHPDAQEAILNAALAAGATVERGAVVQDVRRTPGGAVLSVRTGGGDRDVNARFVVAADGRDSTMRGSAGFEIRRSPAVRYTAGLMFEGIDIDATSAHMWINPGIGSVAYLFPHGPGVGRAFVVLGERSESLETPEGFVMECLRAGVRRDVYRAAKPIGLLATVAASDRWVDHPYHDGVALIGDAAGTSDPTWGQGIATTLRDVRLLRDALGGDDDLDRAGHAYADLHDLFWQTVLELESWATTLMLEAGPEADARRRRAMRLWKVDPSRAPDVFMSGPDGYVLDERARRRYFGED
ncbi:MAG: FAD-dependent monooxygenase [Chloroflexi bacterium]|nr:FAD-dependent monooxygenase [Chloroflexota bacterium]